MQAVRRCVQCNAENGLEQIYCIKCGKFLPKINKSKRNITVWDMGNDEDIVVSNKTHNAIKIKSDSPQRFVVVCPQCAQMTAVENSVIPLACDQCGYFFQAGIDKVVPEPSQSVKVSDFPVIRDSKTQDKTTLAKVTPKVASGASKKNPLGGSKGDSSSMRLIIISKSGVIPEKVKESGEIVGTNGTILISIKTSQQISIWHSPAGWYARTLAGSPLYNGVPVNAGMQIKLNDGDILTVEKDQVRVEIV